jgi:hypothetical protein
VLVNDLLGTRLAEMIGLPVPVPAIVDVRPWLVEHTPDLRVELCGQRKMFTAGLSFGARYVVSPMEGQVYDYLPEGMLGRVRNINSFAGVLALRHAPRECRRLDYDSSRASYIRSSVSGKGHGSGRLTMLCSFLLLPTKRGTSF